MQTFSPNVPKVPYLYRQAVNAGIAVMVKSAKTGITSRLDLKNPVNYKDEYSVSREDDVRLRNIKEAIERNTKFVYTQDLAFRVSKEVLRGDVLTLDDEYFFVVGQKDSITQVAKEKLTDTELISAYPVFEVFDTAHNIAIAAV